MLLRIKRQIFEHGRAIALSVALLLAFVQSLSASHFHQKDFRGSFANQAQVADDACGVCLFHFHSPTNPAPAVSVPEPAVVKHRITTESDGAPVRSCDAPLFSRGPPALI